MAVAKSGAMKKITRNTEEHSWMIATQRKNNQYRSWLGRQHHMVIFSQAK